MYSTSPINTLAGLQLKIRNDNRLPAAIILVKSIFFTYSIKKVTNMVPVTIPSNPSMKFMKLIIAVPINKNIKIFRKPLFIEKKLMD